MDVSVVIGSNYGDEGKGVITDALACRRPDAVVVMANGGAQRGHTVFNAATGSKHSFHHFGSGTFRGCATYFPDAFILNPMQFVKEFWELTDKFKINNLVAVRHKDCLFSTPFDMAVNQAIENHFQQQGEPRGTCGMGIWETLVRYFEMSPRFHPYAGLTQFNLSPHEAKVAFLKMLRDEYCPKRYKQMTGKEWNPPDWVLSDGLITHYIEDVATMCSVCLEDTSEDYAFLATKDNLIFENGQGLLLDEEYDGCDSIYATPSHTGMRNASLILKTLTSRRGIPIRRCDAYYVSRPYLTAHGPSRVKIGSLSSASIYFDGTEANTHNEFQGKFCEGVIDQKAQMQAIKKDMAKYLRPVRASMKTATLAYTHLDQSSPQKLLFPDVAECGTDKGGMEVSGLKT